MAANLIAAEPVVLGGIAGAALVVLAIVWIRRPQLLTQRSAHGVVAFLAIGLLQLLLVLHGCVFRPSSLAIEVINYGYVIEIGLLVGGTEMISRYRDDPFAPLVSTPGIFYVLINGGAAALAYYLMGPLHISLQEPMKTIAAGVGAMAFFRSGVFTARIGNTDVPVGPNLVLQVVLQALDRAYDRQRAVPRSTAVTEIMRGVSFNQVKEALPTLSFDLMQNVSTAETASINTQVAELSSSTMSDDAKLLSLGLAMINVVGEDTLRAAVKALGNDARGFRPVSQDALLALAAIDPRVVAAALPQVCRELSNVGGATPDPGPDFTLAAAELTDESRAVLLLYKLVAYYGEPRVLVAIGILAQQAPPDPALPAPQPPAAPAPPAAAPVATRARTGRRAGKASRPAR